MNVLQSYVSTIGGGHMDLYQLRVWMVIVRRAQEVMTESLATKYTYSDDDVSQEHMRFSCSISEMLPEGNRHYDKVQEAIRALSAHQIEHYDKASRLWRSSPLIYDSMVTMSTGYVSFYVAKWVFGYILDFTHGFCRYHLETAMMLNSSNCIIMYMLTCHLRHAVTYNIAVLKAITGDMDNYKNNGDYVKRVVDAVGRELERRKVNGYTYEVNKVGCRISSITLTPVRRQEEEAACLTAQLPLGQVCGYALKTYLTNQCYFTARELCAHKDLLNQFGGLSGWQDELLDIVERARKKRASKGYIIQAMRSVLRERLPLKYDELEEK